MSPEEKERDLRKKLWQTLPYSLLFMLVTLAGVVSAITVILLD